jgi:hypothetical protein
MNRKKRRPIAILMALGLVAGMLGCGGGASEDNTVTKSAFVKQGNEICTEWQAARSAVFARFNAKFEGQKATRTDKEEGVLELLQPYEKASSRLAALTPPDGDEEKVEAIVSAMEEGAGKIKAQPLSALTNSSAFEEANELSSAYGLKECTF